MPLGDGNSAQLEKSKNYVFGRGNQNARAAGLAKHTIIGAVALGPVVIARIKVQTDPLA
jgi:hypothetical protein